VTIYFSMSVNTCLEFYDEEKKQVISGECQIFLCLLWWLFLNKTS